MRKPVYYAYVAHVSHPHSQGEQNTWWTKVGVAFPHHGKSGPEHRPDARHRRFRQTGPARAPGGK